MRGWSRDTRVEAVGRSGAKRFTVLGEFGGYVPLDHHAVIGRFDLLPAREPDLHELYARVADVLLRPDRRLDDAPSADY